MYVAYDANLGRIYNAFATDVKSDAENALVESFKHDFSKDEITLDELTSIGLELYDIGDMDWLYHINVTSYGYNALTRIATEFNERYADAEGTLLNYLRMQYIIGYMRAEFETGEERIGISRDGCYTFEYLAENDGTPYVCIGLSTSMYSSDDRYQPVLEVRVPLSELHLRTQEPTNTTIVSVDVNTIKQELGL